MYLETVYNDQLCQQGDAFSLKKEKTQEKNAMVFSVDIIYRD